ncbi:MAG: anti-sigma F factor [Defluviitaleaceae bacterium]|nr:anti-sigma F factor [Defluviitaleaceae bacterium]MCL2263975.1 anti-sigma F factor [Defluviitaleaceae bacterium]
MTNKVKFEFAAIPENAALARVVVAAFITPLDPSVGEISDIKTAVSEAVTNAIIHGYNGNGNGNETAVTISMHNVSRQIHIEVSDSGVGIENIASAMEPLFTTKPEMERSGLGFTVMESFMDTVEVTSRPNEGTTIKMVKQLAGER